MLPDQPLQGFDGPPRENDHNRFAEIVTSAREEMARKKARRAERAAAPVPDLTPKPCLVAFIDILGFGREIERANSRPELEAIYHKVRIVQKEFQKESAADDPQEQAEANIGFARTVIALSDAVVVVFALESEQRDLFGPYDYLGSAMHQLVLAQGRCVFNHGIFVRGGLSTGSFFFEDDILISPALARAYEIESERAEYPIIAAGREIYDLLAKTAEEEPYEVDWDASEILSRHGIRRWRNRELYYLDYLYAMLDAASLDWLPEYHWRYKEAKRIGQHELAQIIIDEMTVAATTEYAKCHRERLEAAYHASSSEKVRRKYRWLMRYHNRVIRKFNPALIREQLIQAESFCRPPGT